MKAPVFMGPTLCPEKREENNLQFCSVTNFVYCHSGGCKISLNHRIGGGVTLNDEPIDTPFSMFRYLIRFRQISFE